MQDQQLTNTVTVSGHGSASQAPDTLTLTIAVEVNRPSLTSAYEDTAGTMHAVQEALRSKAPKAVSNTSGLSLRSETVWQEGKGTTITGYSCSSILSVCLPYGEEHQDAQQAIAAVVSAGGETMCG